MHRVRKAMAIVALVVVSCTNVYATDLKVGNTQNVQLVKYNNISELGVVSSYVIPKGKDVYVSRNYSKAVKYNGGDKLDKYGDYIVFDKTSSKKITHFKIDKVPNGKVSSLGGLEEILFYAVDSMQDTIYIDLDKKFLESEDISNRLSTILSNSTNKYPMLAYSGGSFMLSGDKLKVSFNYVMDKKECLKATAAINTSIINYLDNLDTKLTTVELQKKIVYDILSYVQYYEYGEGVLDVLVSHYVQALNSGNNKVVCDGYSKLFMCLANSIGLPTEIITGYADNIGHAWNLVYYDKESYHVDLTWADREKLDSSYINYINEKDDFMKLTHSWDEKEYSKCNFNTYLNVNIYDLVKLDDFLKAKDVTSPVSVEATLGDTSALMKVVDRYKGIVTYNSYDKYGKTIISIFDVK